MFDKEELIEKAENKLEMLKISNPIASKLALNESGELNINGIIMLGIAAIIIAAFIPTAINSLTAADTTGWGTTDTAIFGIIGTVILIVIILGFLNMVR